MNTSLKPARIMYLPQGENEIKASVNGKPGFQRVNVTPECVPLLQRDLEQMQAAAIAGTAPSPCGYFDHKTGPASLIPRKFSWEEGKGVMLDVEWTDAGRKAVEGKDYRYFSPYFAVKGAQPSGLLTGGVEVGSLTNDPAFRNMNAVAASRVDLDGVPGNLAPNLDVEKTKKSPHTPHMDAIKKALNLPDTADAAAIVEAINKLKSGDKEKDLAAAKENAKKFQSEAEKSKKKADDCEKELAAARAEIDTLNKQAAEHRRQKEDAFIAAAHASGRVAPKNEDAEKAWRTLFQQNEASAVAAMNAIPENEALKGDTIAASNVPHAPLKSTEELYREQLNK